jgi:hypothetical protein
MSTTKSGTSLAIIVLPWPGGIASSTSFAHAISRSDPPWLSMRSPSPSIACRLLVAHSYHVAPNSSTASAARSTIPFHSGPSDCRRANRAARKRGNTSATSGKAG